MSSPGGLRATALLEEAIAANAAGSPLRALRTLASADRCLAKEAPGRERTLLHARIDITRAWSLFESGHRDEAYSLLSRVNEVLADLPRGPVHTLAQVQRASMFGRSGDWRQARDTLLSVDVSSAYASPRTACLVHLNLGLSHQCLGEYHESEAQLRRAHQMALAHRFDDLAMAALHNRGRLLHLLGDLPGALRAMEEASAVNPSVMPSSATLDYAQVLIDVGLVDEAADRLLASEQVAARSRVIHDRAESILELAKIHLLRNDPAAALREARRAQRYFVRLAEQTWVTRAELVTCQAELNRGRPERARSAVAALTETGLAHQLGVENEATLVAAEAAAATGRLDQARRLLSRPGLRSARRFPLRLHGCYVRALIAQAEGDDRATAAELRHGVQLLLRRQARIASLDSRTAVGVHSSRLRDLHLDLTLTTGSPTATFATTELWRGVSQRLPTVRTSRDEVMAALLADARRFWQSAYDADDPIARARWEARARAVEGRVARHDWGADGSDELRDRPVRPATVGSLRGRLVERGAGLVSLFTHAGSLWAVTVTPGAARLLCLGPAAPARELARKAQVSLYARHHADGDLRQVVERSLHASVSGIDALLGPAIPATDRVVILPTTTLGSLPFRLLPTLAGRPVTVSPSATTWLSGAGGDSQRDLLRVATLAGPGLARAVAEAADVADSWGSRLPHPPTAPVLGARVDDLWQALARSDLVHVAAHGRHNHESPLFSTIRLTDGPAYAHELQRLDVRAQHVVLSACDVGISSFRPGDEPLGLMAALLGAGVRNVVAAAAPIRDDEAHALMTRYHARLADGAACADALEEASEGIPHAALFTAFGADWSVATFPPSSQKGADVQGSAAPAVAHLR